MSDYHIPPDLVRHDGLTLAQNSLPWSLPPEIWQPIWDAGIDGRSVVIGNGDTGIAANHADLPKPQFARDFTNSSSGVADRNGHGTHTIGTNCGQNGIGVAPGAGLIVAKVLGDSGSGSTTGINAGIRWMADQGADVISLSLGSNGRDTESRSSIQYAESKGAVVVAAAGNSGFSGSKNTIGSPGWLLETLCVGATREDGSIAGFSSGGREMDLAAPGEKIVSAKHTGGRVAMSGTSMATPYVAGCIALLIQVMRRLGRADMTGAEAWRKWLQSSEFVKDAGAPGHDVRFGWGVIDCTQIVNWLRKQSTTWICLAWCLFAIQTNGQDIMSMLAERDAPAKVVTVPVNAFVAATKDIHVEQAGDQSIVFAPENVTLQKGVTLTVETAFKNSRVKLIRGEYDEQDLPKLSNGSYVLIDKPGTYGVRVGLWDQELGFDWLTVPITIGGNVGEEPVEPTPGLESLIAVVKAEAAKVADDKTALSLANAYAAIVWPDSLEKAREVVRNTTQNCLQNRPEPRLDWSGFLKAIDAEFAKLNLTTVDQYKQAIQALIAGLTPGKDATAAKDGIFSNSVIFPTRKIEPVIAGKVQNVPDEETSGLLPITRRSQNNWTDPDVGMWNAANLREHLLGDFQSPVHRGSVPLSQLQGRSLSDLIAIHANLHEGWNWDGTSKQQLQVATIKERLPTATIRNYQTVQQRFNSTCPPGVNCPTGQQSFRLFRRR